MANKVNKFRIELESDSDRWDRTWQYNRIIEIDKGIPIPPIPKKREQLPFREMVVGDSLFVTFLSRERLRQRLQTWLKENGLDWKFRYEVSAIGVRIWRIK